MTEADAALAGAQGRHDVAPVWCAPASARSRVGGLHVPAEPARGRDREPRAGSHWASSFAYGELASDRLIHMNGRVYDYRLGRFLSVDPIISNPMSSQAINPYSYGGNNPLSGVDPTGYSWESDLIIAAVKAFVVISGNGAQPKPPQGTQAPVSDTNSPSNIARVITVGAGVAYGTAQAVAPGGFVTGSPAPNNADFEVGRAAGLSATGIVQVVVGGGQMVEGGAGMAAGATASETGFGVLAIPAGAVVAAEGAAVATQGMANVGAGILAGKNVVEMRASGTGGGGPKTAKEMGQELAADTGKNRVSATTGGDKKVDIDLQGKAHFDKASGQKIDTPHVHESKINRGPDGKTSTSDKTTRPATKEDVRTARKICDKRENC